MLPANALLELVPRLLELVRCSAWRRSNLGGQTRHLYVRVGSCSAKSVLDHVIRQPAILSQISDESLLKLSRGLRSARSSSAANLTNIPHVFMPYVVLNVDSVVGGRPAQSHAVVNGSLENQSSPMFWNMPDPHGVVTRQSGTNSTRQLLKLVDLHFAFRVGNQFDVSKCTVFDK